MQANAAYDLERFAAHAPNPALRVVQSPNAKKRKFIKHLKMIKWAVTAAVFVALVCSVLCAQVESTELSAQMRTQEENLADLQSEFTYLSNEMEMKTNLTSVQQYAANTLKMVKMDHSQVTYVTEGKENKVERPDSGLARIAGKVSQTAASFLEYLAP